MKPFQPRSVEQQRKNYVKACKRQMTVELGILHEQFQDEHRRHAELYHQRCEIDHKIEKIQDRVADLADREHGGWDKWRHDEILRNKVVKDMDEAVVRERERIAELDEKMEKLMAPYHAACEKVSAKYYTLMKTA
jgi:chromosome segregation ATPase